MADVQDSELVNLLRKYEMLDPEGVERALAVQGEAKKGGRSVPLAAVLVQEKILPFQEVDRLVAHGQDEEILCKSCKKPAKAGGLDPRSPFICPSCGKPLPETDTVMDAFATLDSSPPVPPGMVGTKIAGCTINRKIGEGGMGAVYEGTHEHLERQVAVKVLPEYHVNRPGFAERFLRESRSAAKVLHPNVVQVMDAGVDGNTHYIVMEFVEGKSLEELLDEKGQVPIQEALRYVRDSARGLGAAWEHGVIHRDIKPDNIRISSKGVAKVADFGLAKDLESTLKISITGAVMGTPLYMSPEQARGEKVDFRSDIYSLGATLYHLIVGRPPFKGPTPLTVMQKHTEEDPEPLTTSVEDCPPEVEKLVLRMMAKKPEGRFASYKELVKAIDGLLQEATPAEPTSPTPSGSGKIIAWIAAAAILVVAGWAMTRGDGEVEEPVGPTVASGEEEGTSPAGGQGTSKSELSTPTPGGDEVVKEEGKSTEEGKEEEGPLAGGKEEEKPPVVETGATPGEILFFVDAHGDDGLRSKFSDHFTGLGLKITDKKGSASHIIDLVASFSKQVHPVEKIPGTRLSLQVRILEAATRKQLLSQRNDPRYAADFSADEGLRHAVVIDKAFTKMEEELEKKVREVIDPLLEEER